MKIAFFHELHFGGARRVVTEYAKVFSGDHRIELFYVDKEQEKDVEKYFRENRFYKFNFKKYEGGNLLLKTYKDFIEPLKLYFLHKKIAEDIDRKGFDFIFVHPSQFTHAPFLLRFLKTPHIYFCHEPLRIVYDAVVSIPTNINSFKRIYEKAVRYIRKMIDYSNIRRADIVLTNCNYSRENIKKAYGIDAKVCCLGVDSRVFKPTNVKKEYDLIFVGEPIPMEGYDTFEEILKLFNNKLKVKIVKPEKERYITDQMLAEEYNKAKILIVLGRFDPFSMIPWEGMACGVPPVVVNEGGPIEAVENGKTGFLADRDPKEFKKIIEKLLNNGKLRNQIGQAGREEVINSWNWERSSGKVLEIVNKYLKK